MWAWNVIVLELLLRQAGDRRYSINSIDPDFEDLDMKDRMSSAIS